MMCLEGWFSPAYRCPVIGQCFCRKIYQATHQSSPYSEFGDVKGRLVWIGSDALPPEQIRPYFSCPARIALERQYLQTNGRQIALQSGMSLSANIKLRKRKVIQIFTELFTRNVDSLKSVR